MGKTQSSQRPISSAKPASHNLGLAGKVTESYLKHMDLHEQETALAKARAKLDEKSQEATDGIVKNMGMMIEAEKGTVTVLKSVVDTIKLQASINKWLLLLILIFSFHNELLSLWRYLMGVVTSFALYLLSLWPRMTADGQMATVVAVFSFMLGAVATTLWNKRKQK